MHSFKDSTGRTWELPLTIGSIMRIKARADIDLLKLHEGDPPAGVRLTTEADVVARVLFAIVAPKAETSGVTEDQFFDLLDGTTLAAAFDAFSEELIDFFQKTGRTEQAKVFRAALKTLLMAVRNAGQKIDGMDLEKILLTSGLPSTDSPGSSE